MNNLRSDQDFAVQPSWIFSRYPVPVFESMQALMPSGGSAPVVGNLNIVVSNVTREIIDPGDFRKSVRIGKLPPGTTLAVEI